MTHTHLDPEVLKTLQDIMGRDYPSLLDTFLDDIHRRLHELRSATDSRELNTAAHSFKGSCGNMGALHLSELCRQLEAQSSVQSLEHSAALVKGIEAECAVVRELYQRELARFHPHLL